MKKPANKNIPAKPYVEFVIVNSATADLGDPYVSLFATVGGVAANFYVDLKTGIASFNDSQGGASVDVFPLSKLTNGTIKFDPEINASSGRIYFSSDGTVITSGTEPDVVTAKFYFDWVEFSIVGPDHKLVANTTQVDQFGFPIKLTVSPADINFGATAGSNASRSTIISDFKSDVGGDYKDCLFPVSKTAKSTGYYRIMSPNQAIVKKSDSGLATYFTDVIDDFFSYYSKNDLYIAGNSAYPYVGKVTTVSAKDSNGVSHDYPVLQFNLATDGPVNLGLPSTPPSGSGPFNIYYPFFTTNNPAGHTKDFNGNAILPPPHWWKKMITGKGSLNDKESPSQMIFAGNGIFADTFWQLDKTAVDSQTDLLGNLENQVNVAFNRGHATSWFTLSGAIAPGTANSEGGYDTTITLDTSDYSDQNTPKDNTDVEAGMQVLSQAAAIPLKVTAIIHDQDKITKKTSKEDKAKYELADKQVPVHSPLPVLAQNTLYVAFADFYPAGGTWNRYGQFFHREDISIGGRAYALSFDDQGGFSSTLTSLYTSASPSKLTIELVNW